MQASSQSSLQTMEYEQKYIILNVLETRQQSIVWHLSSVQQSLFEPTTTIYSRSAGLGTYPQLKPATTNIILMLGININ